MLTDASAPRYLWVFVGFSGRLVPVHLMTILGRKCFPPISTHFWEENVLSPPCPLSSHSHARYRIFQLAWSSFSSAASEALHEHALHAMDNSKSSCKLCMNLSNGLHRLFTDLPGNGQQAFPEFGSACGCGAHLLTLLPVCGCEVIVVLDINIVVNSLNWH